MLTAMLERNFCSTSCQIHLISFCSRQLFHTDKVDLAVTTSQLEMESEAWLAFKQPLK